MSIRNFGLLSLLALFALVSGDHAIAADKKGDGMSKEMQAMMDKAMKAGSPSEGHTVLKPLAGKWQVAAKSWMKPGDDAQTSMGSSTNEWILGGRFLEQNYKGDWAGNPFEGIGHIGYNNMTQEYVSTWMDSMTTGIMKSTGTYDAKTKTIKDSGTYACPMTGDKDRWYRSEWKIVNKNKNIYSMFVKDDKGKEFKSMELVFERK